MLSCRALSSGVACLFSLLPAARGADDSPLTDKTLVVWVSPANLKQSGGTALTINDTAIDRFDGVVTLRCNERTWTDFVVSEGVPQALHGVVGDSCELDITVNSVTSKQFGVKVRMSAGGREETLLYFDAEAKELCFDSTRSGIDGRRTLEKAPLTLKEGEPLQLRVFVDKSVVEVYANDRQAICRRVYPGRSDSLDVVLFARGGDARISRVRAWEMMPSNPY